MTKPSTLTNLLPEDQIQSARKKARRFYLRSLERDGGDYMLSLDGLELEYILKAQRQYTLKREAPGGK